MRKRGNGRDGCATKEADEVTKLPERPAQFPDEVVDKINNPIEHALNGPANDADNPTIRLQVDGTVTPRDEFAPLGNPVREP